MPDSSMVEKLNENQLDFIRLLGGQVLTLDPDAQTCTFEFNIDHSLCHSGDIVQGGFVTAMLDAAMSHACFGLLENVISVATLEIKVSFFEPSRAGKFRCVGQLKKIGRSTGFLEGQLYSEDGVLTATATTTAKLIRAR